MYIIVIGAGLIGRETIIQLVNNNHDVVVIDKNPEACELIYAETGTITINRDATNIISLEEAGSNKADLLICLTGEDSVNITCALLAKSLGIPKIIAQMKNNEYLPAYRLLGVNIVSLTEIQLINILMKVEHSDAKNIAVIAEGKAGIYSIRIPSNSKIVGKSVKDIAQNSKFPKACNFMGFYDENKGEFYIPRGDDVIKENIDVYLISKSQVIRQAINFLTST